MESRSDGSPLTRALLDPSQTAPEALRQIASFHADVVRDAQRAITTHPVVVIGMAQNPHVKKVRHALKEAGIELTYIEHGSYFSKWQQRLAIKLWSGWPTFPQVFVRGVLLGGEDLTVAAIRDGSLRRMLDKAG